MVIKSLKALTLAALLHLSLHGHHIELPEEHKVENRRVSFAIAR